MCIRCDASKFNAATAAFVNDLSEALVDAIGVVEHMKARGITLDADEKAVYDRVFNYAKGSDAEPKPGAVNVTNVVDNLGEAGSQIVDAIKRAFPGATVVVGTPEQVEAMLEKEVKGDKPN